MTTYIDDVVGKARGYEKFLSRFYKIIDGILRGNEKYPSGFMIENKHVADAFRKWFELIGKGIKK